jgi:hypothetical protein
MSRPRRDPDRDDQPVSDGVGRNRKDATANAATHAAAVSAADRQARATAEPPDLELLEPEWPDPAWPGFAPGRRRPSYAFVLSASPWFKEHYPDQAANLWDALHAGRSPQPAPEPEPDRLADREAGE